MKRDPAKPHLALRGALWTCSSCVNWLGPSALGPQLNFWVIGKGATPAEAFKNWEATKHGA